MNKKVVVFGCGGFGREVMWVLEENIENGDNWEILGFIDDRAELTGQVINNYKVLGTTDWLIEYKEEINVIIGVGSSQKRKKIINILKSNSLICFPTLISKSANISKYTTIGEGCIICSGTIVTVNAILKNFVIVNLDCTIGHDALLCDYVTLYPSVNISGSVKVDELTEIGTGTQIIQGVNIGSNSIIGAGAVVIRDIPKDITAVGNPARFLTK